MLYSEKVEKAEHAVKAWRYQNSSEPGVPSAPGLKMIKLSASAQKLQRQGPFYPHRFQPILSQSAHLKKKKKIYSHQMSTTSAAGEPEPEQMWREEEKVRRRHTKIKETE